MDNRNRLEGKRLLLLRALRDTTVVEDLSNSTGDEDARLTGTCLLRAVFVGEIEPNLLE